MKRDTISKAQQRTFDRSRIPKTSYSEIGFDGYRAPSIFEIDGAKDVAIEFHSLSKTFNMTGWRIGFACGNMSIIEGLAKVKSNIDSGIFCAIQHAGAVALDNYDRHIKSIINYLEEHLKIKSICLLW